MTEPTGPKLAIKTPAETTSFSRGFYQVEEDTLYVPLFPGGRFFSYLDSPQVSLQTDRKGRLVFIQILAPRRNWTVADNMVPPSGLESADIRFLDFRDKLDATDIEVNPAGDTVRIVFASVKDIQTYRITDNLLFDVTPDERLAAIWIFHVEDDRAAEKMAAWRKEIAGQVEEETPREKHRRIEVSK